MDDLNQIIKNAGITEASESEWDWDIENDFNEKVQYVSLFKGGQEVCRIPAADFESIVSDFSRFLSRQPHND